MNDVSLSRDVWDIIDKMVHRDKLRIVHRELYYRMKDFAEHLDNLSMLDTYDDRNHHVAFCRNCKDGRLHIYYNLRGAVPMVGEFCNRCFDKRYEYMMEDL